MKLKNTNILLAILTSKKNIKWCDQTQNFGLSIKLIDKNHIIYNKKITNTQNLFNLMKKNKLPARLQVRQRGITQHFSIMKAATSKISTHEKHYHTNIVKAKKTKSKETNMAKQNNTCIVF